MILAHGNGKPRLQSTDNVDIPRKQLRNGGGTNLGRGPLQNRRPAHRAESPSQTADPQDIQAHRIESPARHIALQADSGRPQRASLPLWPTYSVLNTFSDK